MAEVPKGQLDAAGCVLAKHIPITDPETQEAMARLLDGVDIEAWRVRHDLDFGVLEEAVRDLEQRARRAEEGERSADAEVERLRAELTRQRVENERIRTTRVHDDALIDARLRITTLEQHLRDVTDSRDRNKAKGKSAMRRAGELKKKLNATLLASWTDAIVEQARGEAAGGADVVFVRLPPWASEKDHNVAHRQLTEGLRDSGVRVILHHFGDVFVVDRATVEAMRGHLDDVLARDGGRLKVRMKPNARRAAAVACLDGLVTLDDLSETRGIGEMLPSLDDNDCDVVCGDERD